MDQALIVTEQKGLQVFTIVQPSGEVKEAGREFHRTQSAMIRAWVLASRDLGK